MRAKAYIFSFLLIAVGAMVVVTMLPSNITTAEINSHPSQLNGKTIRGVQFEDIVFENVTLKDVTFDNVRMRSFVARNVIFINCHFLATRVIEASFEGVKFVGGSFQTRGDFYDPDKKTEFRYIDKFDVIFDDVSFYQPDFGEISSGNILIKNIKNYKVNTVGSHNFIIGDNLNVRIDNCNFERSTVVVTHNNSKIYVTNTIMHNGSGFMSGADIFYASKCVLDGGGGGEECVIQDSEVGNGVSGVTVYLINNRYKKITRAGFTYTPVLDGGKSSKFYILGSQIGEMDLHMVTGSYYLYDVNLSKPIIYSSNGIKGIEALNLRNVNILGGSFWQGIVKSGQWENVKIYPEVNIEDANIENIVGYNVTFPEGSPWRGKAKNASMAVSKTPFEWPEIKVPTPEELGLIWDWPEPTGAPPVAQ